MVITARLPAEQGALVLAALEAARAAIDHGRQATAGPADSAGPSGADNHGAAGRPGSPPGCGQLSSAEERATCPEPAVPAEPARAANGDRTADPRADSKVDSDVGCPVDPDSGPGSRPDSRIAGRAGCGELSSAEESPARADRPVAKGATRSEGLLRLAQYFLDRSSRDHRPAARRFRAQLIPQIDPLSGWARLPDNELLPPVCTQALRNSLGRRGRLRLRRLRAADLSGRDLGRTRREPTPTLRELLGVLDGERCRFPGCTRRRKLHAHHVRMWSAGGATDLDNLVLLCARHHTLVHADGYQLSLHTDRRLTVLTRDGILVPHRPSLPWRPADELDPETKIGPGTLPPTVTDARLDLGYAVSVLLQQAA